MGNINMEGGGNVTIEFHAKNVYGKTNLYINDPKLAATIRVLTGKATVDAYDLAALIALGHDVKEVGVDRVVLPSIEKSLVF